MPLVAVTASGPQPSSVSSVKAGVIAVGSTQIDWTFVVVPQ